MANAVDWDALEKLSQQVTQPGESPGSFPETDWERIHLALLDLQSNRAWSEIIRLRKIFSGLYARDSAWGIPVIQSLDEAAINAAHQIGNASELGHLLGARGHNLHRQGLHLQSIAAFEESAKYYSEIGDNFGALKSKFMTSLCYRALNNRVKARAILREVLEQVDTDNPWRGNPLQVMAWLTQDEGDLPTSEKLLREVLSLHERGSDTDILIAGTLADLGEVVGLQGRFIEAIEYFQKSLTLLNRYSGQYNRQEARTKLKYAELLMRQGDLNSATRLLDEADDLASGYGHYYDLMWRIELARCLIFARKCHIQKSLLKMQMVMRYRRILGLSSWLLIKQLVQRYWAGTGLPR